MADPALAAAQQAGSIRGVVYDKEFDTPLPAAQVQILETGQKTATANVGNYVFGQVAPGRYTLIFSREGYVRQVKADVVVQEGKLTDVDVSLAGEFAELDEFVVQDVLQPGAGSETALLNLRFESSALMDSIGSELMSRAGASDAAAALKLVAGASVQDGKFAVIRGLPDRYVSSQMNGVRLPSADESKRAVELDQFPAAVIESIQVSKTFTPDQQGDASGGAVNLAPASPATPETDTDERLRRILPQLRSLFRYTEYTTIERHRAEVTLGTQQRFPLPGARQLEVVPDQLQGQTVRMRVRLLRDEQPELHTVIVAAPGAPAVLGGPSHGDGVLIIILWANPNPTDR